MVGKIPFAGVKTEFEPIPTGTYDAVFKDYKFGKTKGGANPGTDKVDLQFAVTEEGEFLNHRAFRTCTFTPESLWAFKRVMVALGADVDWEDPEGIDPDAVCRSVMDAPCIIKITLDPEGYEDPKTGEKRPSSRLDDVLPTEQRRLEAEEARAAAAQPSFDSEPAPEVVEMTARGRR